MCKYIIEQATSLKVHTELVSCINARGFTPLIEVAFRGYHTVGEKEEGYDNRFRIVEKLLDAGADPNYCRDATGMTALHWLGHNDDRAAIQVLLDKGADDLLFNHEMNLPIDIAGTTPALSSVDAFLDNFANEKKIINIKLANR